ncbi:MAG: hypothetical protein EZS28_024869 [Streblomastix strix]|uniref:Uncharacterized protein n=1 Tax=Streblomastix strix TaxID=222440 RepID=A0A5J4VB42_9EUKA|nr:MAG: hypothetical protein EZS28_024869 [Streblomastix strix]
MQLVLVQEEVDLSLEMSLQFAIVIITKVIRLLVIIDQEKDQQVLIINLNQVMQQSTESILELVLLIMDEYLVMMKKLYSVLTIITIIVILPIVRHLVEVIEVLIIMLYLVTQEAVGVIKVRVLKLLEGIVITTVT